MYYLGIEELAKDEIRVIACGTGMPSLITLCSTRAHCSTTIIMIVSGKHYDGTLPIASDLMVWNITKDKITEPMTVITGNAQAVEGTTRQPPPQPGWPDPMSDFIKLGEWGPGFNAQNQMLDDFSEEYNLQDQDWRKTRPWYKPSE